MCELGLISYETLKQLSAYGHLKNKQILLNFAI